jgi:hypothetical protein
MRLLVGVRATANFEPPKAETSELVVNDVLNLHVRFAPINCICHENSNESLIFSIT